MPNHKVIPGFSRYAISKDGEVIRIVSNGKHNGYIGKIIKQNLCNRRYRVSLTNDAGIEKTLLIHRLILLTYVGPSHLQVNHIDGNPSNNHISNLEYCTGEENITHGVKNGLFSRGNKHHNTKITPEDVRKIRSLYAQGVKPTKLSTMFPLSRNTIKDIIKKKTWKYVT